MRSSEFSQWLNNPVTAREIRFPSSDPINFWHLMDWNRDFLPNGTGRGPDDTKKSAIILVGISKAKINYLNREKGS